MAGYTHLNLKSDVDDSAVKFGFAPNMEARFASGALGLEKCAMSYQRVAPGARQPFGHSHGEQEELYVIIRGTGRMKLDDEVIEVGTLDAIRVSPSVTRAFEAGPDGLEFVAFGAPNVGDPGADAQPKPGWWKD